MEPAHLAFLKRQAQISPRDSAQLGAKVKALRELLAYYDIRSSPKLLEVFRNDLLDVIHVAGELGTVRAQDASSLANTLLAELNSEYSERPNGEPLRPWEAPGLSPEEREEERAVALGWLELDILSDMVKCLGWHFEKPGSKTMTWLSDQAEQVLSAEDPFAAWEDWMSDPPAPPAGSPRVRLSRPARQAVPVPDDDGPVDDDEES